MWNSVKSGSSKSTPSSACELFTSLAGGNRLGFEDRWLITAWMLGNISTALQLYVAHTHTHTNSENWHRSISDQIIKWRKEKKNKLKIHAQINQSFRRHTQTTNEWIELFTFAQAVYCQMSGKHPKWHRLRADSSDIWYDNERPMRTPQNSPLDGINIRAPHPLMAYDRDSIPSTFYYMMMMQLNKQETFLSAHTHTHVAGLARLTYTGAVSV